MHQALYRKFRPTTFSDVCGQDHITSILQYEVENLKTLHAYLLCGSRGTGKTTCAKILAKSVNCQNPQHGNPCGMCEACLSIDSGNSTDVLEMDAASNNGVDYIRNIRDEVIYLPSMLKYRVYIIDEVHMLSQSAFNALLKTLEEPPPHVIFILATTELQKIPATILSRCQRFDFRRIPAKIIADRLSFIAQNEKIQIDTDATFVIAKLAQGGLRDAISLLELCSSENKKITVSLVSDIIGISDRENVIQVVKSISKTDYETIFDVINKLFSSSKDITVFWYDLIEFYRDMMVVKSTKKPDAYLDLSENQINEVIQIASEFKYETLLYHCKLLDESLYSMQKNNSIKRLTAEFTLIRMSDEKLNTSNEALIARISSLENIVSSNTGITPPSQKISPPTINTNVEQSENSPSLPYWMDAVKKFEKIDKGAATFLQLTKAYKRKDGIYIYAPDKFSKDILNNENKKSQIISIINIYEENCTYTDNNVRIEIFDSGNMVNQDEFANIDELIANTEL